MSDPRAAAEDILVGSDLTVRYRSQRRLRETLSEQPTSPIVALDGVSLTLRRGETLAVVGESGSGKTTAAHALMRLIDTRRAESGGSVRFNGREVMGADRAALRDLRRAVQLVFQDPYESLDPRFSVFDTLAEPLRVYRLVSGRSKLRERAGAILEKVGLDPGIHLDRFPHELSGGQRQRVTIAAALILEPAVLIADEPVSMLDMSVRAGVLALLRQLGLEGLAIMMITHDLSTAAHYADRVAVMYLGRVVEEGEIGPVIESPQHPYTRALLSCVPGSGLRRTQTSVRGEIPDAAAIPPGCRFHPRCPVALPECVATDPDLRGERSGHRAACILVRDDARQNANDPLTRRAVG